MYGLTGPQGPESYRREVGWVYSQVFKMMDFAFKLMDLVFKMMDFVLEMMVFLSRLMNLGRPGRAGGVCRGRVLLLGRPRPSWDGWRDRHKPGRCLPSHW